MAKLDGAGRPASRQRAYDEAVADESVRSSVYVQPVIGPDSVPARIWIGKTGRGRGTDKGPLPAAEPVLASLALTILAVIHVVNRGGWSVYAAPDNGKAWPRGRWRMRCRNEDEARRSARAAAAVIRSGSFTSLTAEKVRARLEVRW